MFDAPLRVETVQEPNTLSKISEMIRILNNNMILHCGIALAGRTSEALKLTHRPAKSNKVNIKNMKK